MLTLVLTAIALGALRGAVGKQSQAVIRSIPLDYIVLERGRHFYRQICFLKAGLMHPRVASDSPYIHCVRKLALNS